MSTCMTVKIGVRAWDHGSLTLFGKMHARPPRTCTLCGLQLQ